MGCVRARLLIDLSPFAPLPCWRQVAAKMSHPAQMYEAEQRGSSSGGGGGNEHHSEVARSCRFVKGVGE